AKIVVVCVPQKGYDVLKRVVIPVFNADGVMDKEVTTYSI
ncbi:unnamed protein product, partial [marine sediment metagenome]